MRGSTGELTALMRVARVLDRGRFDFAFAEAIQRSDPHPRTDCLARSVGSVALTYQDARGELKVSSEGRTLLRNTRPDLILFSTIRSFSADRRLVAWLREFSGVWLDQGCALAMLDPCGDYYVSDVPDYVGVIQPAPYRYADSKVPAPLRFQCGIDPTARPQGSKWLWCGAPWMKGYERFIAAEHVFFSAVAGLPVPLVLTSLPSASLRNQYTLVDDAASAYDSLEQVLGSVSLVVTANHRSVLVARAAARGIPVVFVDLFSLEQDPALAPQVNLLIERAGREALPYSPVPIDWALTLAGSATRIRSLLAEALELEDDLWAAQKAKLDECRALPGPNEAIFEAAARSRGRKTRDDA